MVWTHSPKSGHHPNGGREDARSFELPRMIKRSCWVTEKDESGAGGATAVRAVSIRCGATWDAHRPENRSRGTDTLHRPARGRRCLASARSLRLLPPPPSLPQWRSGGRVAPHRQSRTSIAQQGRFDTAPITDQAVPCSLSTFIASPAVCREYAPMTGGRRCLFVTGTGRATSCIAQAVGTTTARAGQRPSRPSIRQEL